MAAPATDVTISFPHLSHRASAFLCLPVSWPWVLGSRCVSSTVIATTRNGVYGCRFSLDNDLVSMLDGYSPLAPLRRLGWTVRQTMGFTNRPAGAGLVIGSRNDYRRT